MVQIGYKLSSQDTNPVNLFKYVKQTEEAGSGFVMIRPLPSCQMIQKNI